MLNDQGPDGRRRRPFSIQHCAFSIRRKAAAGGGSRTRTGDIRLAKPTLYQLSYAPGAAREAGSGSVSVYAGGFQFFVLGGVASKLAAPCVAGSTACRPTMGGRSTRRIDHRNSRSLGVRLLRKEVIQPQVPLRLPCYDFIPITTHTLDGSPLADGPPASGADGFHDVTGGVYKARERIHGTNC